MVEIDRLMVLNSDSIRDALTVIDECDKKMCLVVDKQKILLGTVSDGDIRRGLLRGTVLDDKIETVMYTDFISIMDVDVDRDVIKNARERGIYEIPIIDKNGILVGLQEVGSRSIAERSSHKIVLMVGGLGSRLKPLTDEIPKPMLKVGGRPILETIIKNFSKFGFKEFIFGVNYKPEIIKEYFGDGSKFGVNIEYVVERKKMGTAGALSLMRDKLHSDFFVMNGDLLTNVNLEQLLDYHYDSQSVATMCVREYDFQVPYGVVKLKGSSVVSIDEKPVHKFFVNAGIYMLSHESLSFIPDDEYYDMPTLLDSIIAANKSVVSFPLREYWLDIGNIDEYERANREYGDVLK